MVRLKSIRHKTRLDYPNSYDGEHDSETSMKFAQLGQDHVIGASCHYVQAGDVGIILDAGQNPNDDGPAGLPAYSLLDKHLDLPLDHVLITHSHHDHVGSLPVLLRKMPFLSVHMSHSTRLLLDIILPASARLQKRRVLEGVANHPPMYDQEQVDAQSFLYEGHGLEEPFALPGLYTDNGPMVSLYHAGHVLGAVGVKIDFEEDGEERSFFYTSDTNTNDQEIQPGGQYPDEGVDILLLESTLGADPNMADINRVEQAESLGERVAATISRGGSVLIPVFALGRSQEVITLVGKWKEEGMIPDTTPVYTAGSMRGMSDIYDKTRFSTPRNDPHHEIYSVQQKRLPRNRDRINETLKEPAIHIAASGMMFENTLSNRLASLLVKDELSSIFFVGYLKEDCPGDRLIKASENGEQVLLSDKSGHQEVKCEVQKFRLSGHSDRDELLSIVDKVSPKKVLLVHGEQVARDWMKSAIEKKHPEIEVICPNQGEIIDI